MYPSRGSAVVGLLLLTGLAGAARAEEEYRLSGPVVRENLAVYFIHGASREGPVPLTLQEALAKHVVRVYETGSVNELAIENLGDEAVFIQSGDIVTGGRQDRALTASLILKPRSGRVPLAAFCVEQGRWSGRPDQDSSQFSTAAASVPSREARLALATSPSAPATPPSVEPVQLEERARAHEEVSRRQYRIWTMVARMQENLGSLLGNQNSRLSTTSSLPMAMENRALAEERLKIIQSLPSAKAKADQPIAVDKDLAAEEPDIIGYVIAVNGELSSADIYPSHALFRKMWPKLLSAAATESIIARYRAPPATPAGKTQDQPGDGTAPRPTPTIETAQEFLAAAAGGKLTERNLVQDVALATRESERVLFAETRGADGRWVHRSYLAR